jgi:hypothetical protein
MAKRDVYVGYAYSVRIIPPLAGKYHFAGKVKNVGRRLRSGEVQPVAYPGGEVWGETEAEAESKARAKAVAWIEAQGGIAEVD